MNKSPKIVAISPDQTSGRGRRLRSSVADNGRWAADAGDAESRDGGGGGGARRGRAGRGGAGGRAGGRRAARRCHQRHLVGFGHSRSECGRGRGTFRVKWMEYSAGGRQGEVRSGNLAGARRRRQAVTPRTARAPRRSRSTSQAATLCARTRWIRTRSSSTGRQGDRQKRRNSDSGFTVPPGQRPRTIRFSLAPPRPFGLRSPR